MLFAYFPGVRPQFLSFPTRRSSDLCLRGGHDADRRRPWRPRLRRGLRPVADRRPGLQQRGGDPGEDEGDRKSTRLNASHVATSYAVICLKKKNDSMTQFLGAATKTV